MSRPLLRRALACSSLVLFTLFWVTTIAEAWCPMHAGWTASPASADHAQHAEHGFEAPEGPQRCLCPGDCGGPVVAALVAPAASVGDRVRAFDAPAPLTRGAIGPGRPQLRLPYATAPPVA